MEDTTKPKPHINSRKTAIKDPEQRRLRALMMVQFRVKNQAPIAEIAKEFNVHPKTVRANLTWASRAGFIADAEDRILQDLVPAAHKAIKEALEAGNAQVALEIFKGVLPGFGKTKPTVTITGGDDLDTYLAQLRAEQPSYLEGETQASTPQLLPAAAQSAANPRDDAHDRREPDGDRSPQTNSQDMGPSVPQGIGNDPA